MLGKYLLTVWVNFYLPFADHPGPFQAQVEATNTGK
jgi:hypothetical protein